MRTLARSIAPRPVAAALLAVLAATLAGCGMDESRDLTPNEQADIAFQEGADRPPSAKTLFGLARILSAQGRDPAAETVLLRTIRDYPDFAPAYGELAELHMRNERTDQAVRVLSAGLRVAPREPTFYNNLGMCSCFKGQYELALDMFTKAASLAPHDSRYRANIAMALGMLGRYDESFATYCLVLPEHEAHYNLAVLYQANNEEAQAAREFEKADALRPRPSDSDPNRPSAVPHP